MLHIIQFTYLHTRFDIIHNVWWHGIVNGRFLYGSIQNSSPLIVPASFVGIYMHITWGKISLVRTPKSSTFMAFFILQMNSIFIFKPHIFVQSDTLTPIRAYFHGSKRHGLQMKGEKIYICVCRCDAVLWEIKKRSEKKRNIILIAIKTHSIHFSLLTTIHTP